MLLIMAIGLGIVTLLLFRFLFVQNYQYKRTDDILYNPLMGYAPNADNPDKVDKNTLVYVDVTWRELEPSEGVYDFATLKEEKNLERWREEGKNVVFRLICDVPGTEEHMDIPDWLYEKTGDGVFYDGEYGKGYAPEYDNETFITYHEKAILALGKEFGEDSFFGYIQLGSLGHWGEWHVKYDEGMPLIPGEETCERYIRPYVSAFPNAKIMMRRPFKWTKTEGFGVFNDMTGDPDDTKDWLNWIAEGGSYTEPKTPHSLVANPDIYKISPIGGEFTSGISMEDMLTSKLKETVSLIQKSHMTFIGPKCPGQEQWELYEEGTKAVLAEIGYRYGVSEASFLQNKLTHTIRVKMKLNNYGAAPMYANWPVYLYQLDEEGRILAKEQVGIELKELFGGESAEVKCKMPYESQGGRVRFGIGIENPNTGKPEVELDMEVERIGKITVLGEIKE